MIRISGNEMKAKNIKKQIGWSIMTFLAFLVILTVSRYFTCLLDGDQRTRRRRAPGTGNGTGGHLWIGELTLDGGIDMKTKRMISEQRRRNIMSARYLWIALVL